ncbi:MAG: TIR domain-containing protein, partial [Clostridia bacterium]|nr:TIR domain-containing protein [Clostridia bacterium]
MKAYEGNEKYIFISYAHKDSATVLPIIEKMQNAGFRVWYDEGIEAGTEWPEYIAEHLESACTVVAFMSNNAAISVNCRNEINFALSMRKEVLVVYLEETKLTAGMRLQIGTLQSLFRYRHTGEESFLRELMAARILAECKNELDEEKLRAEERAKIRAEILAELEAETRAKILAEMRAKEEAAAKKDGKIVCKNGSVYVLKYGITEIEGKTYNYNINGIVSVVLPNSVTTIGTRAFIGCTSLTS